MAPAHIRSCGTTARSIVSKLEAAGCDISKSGVSYHKVFGRAGEDRGVKSIDDKGNIQGENQIVVQVAEVDGNPTSPVKLIDL